MQLVDLIWLPGAHPTAPSLPLLSRMGGEKNMQKLQCGSFPWAEVLHELLQSWAISMGYSPSGTDCSGTESSMGCGVGICPSVAFHRLQGHNLLHHVLLRGLQGNLCSGTWNTASSFFTDLGICRAVSLTLFSLLSHSCCTAFSTLSYTLVMGSALGGSGCVLELAGTGCLQLGCSSWCLLAEAALAAPGHHHLTM